MRHVVALSGGKDSCAMALRLKELHPNNAYEFICTPTGNELPEVIEHWLKIGKMLGTPILPITSGTSLQGRIRKYNTLPSWRMRWCTRELKIKPFQAYLAKSAPVTSYVGIRYDEIGDREDAQIDGVINRYPLVEWEWGIAEVKGYLHEKGVTIPKRTDCAMCFYQRLGEWWLLWKDHPDEYREAVYYEELTGHTLRSDDRDSWPASLSDMALEFEKGRTPKGADQMTFELGVDSRKAMCSFCAR